MEDLDSQTRELLLDYLDGSVTLDDVRRKFMRLAWALSDDEIVRDNPVTARSSLFLAEFGAGHRDETELRDLLAELVGTVEVSYPSTGSSWSTGGSTATQAAQWPQLVEVGR